MELIKDFRYGFVASLALLSFGVMAGEPEYVPGEVLIVTGDGFPANAALAQGMSIQKVHKGRTNFSKVKLKSEQTVEQAVALLKTTPGILHVEPNYIYHATAVPTDPDFSNYWGLQNTGQVVNGTYGGSGVDIDAVTAWDTLTDCSVVLVAVVDSGIDYNHPDLAANIWSNTSETADNGIDDDGNGFIDDIRGWDFVYGDNSPMDTRGHGTHVAGTIGAEGNNATGGVGVCWQASLMPVRVLDGDGAGTTENLVAGVEYAVANGAKIINLSLGGTGYSSLFNTAIADANAAGVLVVAAAGNDGGDNDLAPIYPASYDQPNIISVAAINQLNSLASFSNYGANSVDVVAPGVDIYSSIPGRTSVCSWNFDDGTKQGWTTSTYNTSTATAVTDTMGVTTATANSGSYSLTDSIVGNYESNRVYTATSPTCDLSGVSDAKLEFAANLSVEFFYDRVLPLVSSDGTAWTSLLDNSFYTGHSGGWATGAFDLSSWGNTAALQVRWTLTTDGSGVDDGVYFDDIAVTKPTSTYVGTEYAFNQGTSMAAPHVAGVAALTLAANPTMTVSELRSRVVDSGDWFELLGLKTVSGRRVNADYAVTGVLINNLTATDTGTQIDLAWGDIASETEYQIWQKMNSYYYSTVALGLAANTTSYSDVVTLPSDTSYTYQVRAVTPTGTIVSNPVTVATLPTAPSNVTATYVSSGSYVSVTWTDNSASESGFQVKRDGVLISTVSGSNSYRDSNITDETTYTYEILAVNAAGSVSGGTAVATTPIAAPTEVHASALSSSQIQVTWTDNSSIETNYSIEMYDDYAFTYTSVGTATADSTSYTVSGLQPSTFYWFRVTAVGASSSATSSTTAGTYTQSASSSSGGGGGGAFGAFLFLMFLPLCYRLAPLYRGKG